MEYTVSLAVVDFLPVIFSAIGFYFVVHMVTHIDEKQGKIAAIGAVLTVVGGLIKAIWKLNIAATGNDIRWMDDGMFAWMAPGYTIMAWSIWQAVRSVRGKKTFHIWLIPALISALTLASSFYLVTSAPESLAWKRVLLSVMVLASIITSVLLIIFAFRQKLTLAGVLFVVNLIIIFVMNGLARMPEQTITLQWIEESINSISWLCFAIASYKIYEHTHKTFGLD
ncbi:MAG: hypothetical protein GY755_02415 [Chloroflexi bacterium]|nr:hypothetical protein [Chloroflexota bacterium]